MTRLRFLIATLTLLAVVSLSCAADLPLSTASGTVVTANASVLIIRPRNAEGQFGKALSMKLRGTSKFWSLTLQNRDGKPVLVQKEGAASDLQKNQTLAVIYTLVKDEYVLLQAVAEPASAK
jgi:hypothetical protein